MNMEDHINYYSEHGEKLKIMYKLEHFLNNSYTKKILYEEWNELFRKTIEEPLLDLIVHEKERQNNLGTELFRNDNGGQFEGELVSELSYHIKPTFDLEIFYNNPDLAKNIDDI